MESSDLTSRVAEVIDSIPAGSGLTYELADGRPTAEGNVELEVACAGVFRAVVEVTLDHHAQHDGVPGATPVRLGVGAFHEPMPLGARHVSAHAVMRQVTSCATQALVSFISNERLLRSSLRALLIWLAGYTALFNGSSCAECGKQLLFEPAMGTFSPPCYLPFADCGACTTESDQPGLCHPSCAGRQK